MTYSMVMLIVSRVPPVEVQEWLGYISIATTANLYSHLSYSTKVASAGTLKKLNILYLIYVLGS